MQFPERVGCKTTPELREEVLKLSGNARERWVIDQVHMGLVPDWMRWPSTVTLRDNIPVAIEVTPDYLTLGDDHDWFIMPVNMVTAQEIAYMIGANLPTKEMVDLIYEQAEIKLEAQPWGPPFDHTMMSSKRFLGQAEKDFNRTKDLRRSKAGALSSLVAGHRKDYVLHPLLDAKHTAIYGWFKTNGVPIQGPGVQYRAHSADYVDYSQAPRFVDERIWVGDDIMTLEECMKDPMLARVVGSRVSNVWHHPALSFEKYISTNE